MARRSMLALVPVAICTIAWTLQAEPNFVTGVPLEAWIAGDEEVPPDEDCGWTAIADGGTTPYSYKWWGGLTGTSQSVIGSLHASSWLWVEVKDSSTPAAYDTASILVDVDNGYTCQW